jgi:hypothetical protein
MRLGRTLLVLRLVLGIVLLGMSPLLPGSQSDLAYAQAPQPIFPSQWQALAQNVAVQLGRVGIPVQYIPALTQEYLGAFQRALMLGATVPQADILATQHVTAVMQRALAAGVGGGPTLTYGNAGGLGYQIGSDGQGFTGAFFSDGTGVSCGPDSGCIYSK